MITIETLRPPLHQSNAFFSISMLIAALVQYSQIPSIFEVLLINGLVNLQINIILTMPFLMFLERKGWRWPLSRMRLLYHATISVAQIAVSYANGLPRSAFPEYYNISLACQSFRGYVNVVVYFAPSQNSSSN